MLSSLFLKSGNCEQKILLFHGNSILQIDYGQNPVNYPIDQLDAYLKANRDVLCLLASPLLISYVHETIHLKKNELLVADKKFFSSSYIPSERRIVESIQVNKKKAVTIHSHLTQRGYEMVARLEELEKEIRWQGAVSYLVQNLLNYPQSERYTKRVLGCFLEEDILKITWRPTTPHIQLIQNWLPLKKVRERLPYFRNMLNLMPIQNRSYIELNFNKQEFDTVDLSLLTSLLFPRGEKQRFRTFKKTGSKGEPRLHTFRIKYLIILIYILSAVWLIVTEIEYKSMIAKRSVLSQNIGSQQTVGYKQKELETFEKRYFQKSVLFGLIRGRTFSLPKRLKVLENYLNSSSFWISSYESDLSTTTLSLVTSSSEGEKELEELITELEKLGEISLLADEMNTEQGVQLQEYKILLVHHNQIAKE